MNDPAPRGRLLSVDALRGATVAGMILVNNPGSWSHIYPPLRHADWHGWTPTDLVFPFFLFLVGVSVPLAFDKRIERGDPRGELVRKVVRRSAILFGLGLLLAGFPFVSFEDGLSWRPQLEHIRIPGVLQRIALCYLGASLLYLFTGLRTRVAVCVACLLGYWALMTWVPVPGHGAGQIDGKDTHLAAYIDRLILDGHLWSQSKTWDPEGILSTFPALATTLLGSFTGMMLQRGSPAQNAARLLGVGAVCVGVGWLWGLVFPNNKPIRTSSYAVFTAGLAMSLLGLFTWVIDVRGHRRWAEPLRIYGVNAITVFVGSGLVAKSMYLIRVPTADGDITLKAWIYQTFFTSWLSGELASLAYAITWVLSWFAVLWVLARKGIVI